MKKKLKTQEMARELVAKLRKTGDYPAFLDAAFARGSLFRRWRWFKRGLFEQFLVEEFKKAFETPMKVRPRRLDFSRACPDCNSGTSTAWEVDNDALTCGDCLGRIILADGGFWVIRVRGGESMKTFRVVFSCRLLEECDIEAQDARKAAEQFWSEEGDCSECTVIRQYRPKIVKIVEVKE